MDANQALDALLAGRLEPGVYQWRTPPVPGAIGDAGAFLRLCAGVFEVPALADGDWDDLAGCLKDLSWTPAKNGYLVLYESWAELADTDQKALKVVLDVFGDAVKTWQDTPTPITVLMASVGVEVAGVPRLV